VELIFGYGRYMCAGKVIAFLELNKIFFEVSKLGVICLNLPLSLSLSFSLSLSLSLFLSLSLSLLHNSLFTRWPMQKIISLLRQDSLITLATAGL